MPATTRILPALLLLATGCGVLPSSAEEAAASGPEPPEVVDGVPDPIPPAPADGRHRFIVWPSTSISATAAMADTTPPSDPAWTLDQSLIDRIDEDTVVVFEDGIPGFYDEGIFVALVGNSTASSGTPVPRSSGPSVTEPDVVAGLLELDGVLSVLAIGDGSFAVVAEEADTLDGQGLQTMVDTPFALAADPYESYQWTLDNTGDNLGDLTNPPSQTADADIDGLEAMAGPRGEGVVVAVIDTGVDFSHPDLAGQSWVNDDEICSNLTDDDGNGFVDDCNGWDFGNDDNVPFSPGQQDHGTHVAGIIAAIAGNGVGVVGLAPDVKIMDLNVQGAGGMTMSGISRAVRYAADNGADIINMSLGTQPGTQVAAVGSLIEAVRYAESRGTLVVVAAGNSSVDLGGAAVYPASIEGPGMITVGASAPDDTKASFSNYGSPVDVFAPGVLIVSTVPGGGYKFMNGTSMASPTVAGAAAAVLSADPDLDPQGVRAHLVGTADEVAAFEGLAANPVRINQAWALGLDGDPEVAKVTVSGLASVGTDGVVATISMSDPNGDYEEPYRWEATLVTIDGGQAYGLVDHPVSVDWQDDETDDRGAVTIAAGGREQARLVTDLPAGTYGLIVEAVPEDDPTMRFGDAFVSTFVVPAEPAPDPEPDPDPGPDQGAPDPGSTTTVPGDQTPTTTSPGSTTGPPAQPGPTTTGPPPTTGPSASSTTTGGPTTTGWSVTTRPWPPTTSPAGSSPTTTTSSGGGASSSPTPPPVTLPPSSSTAATPPSTGSPPTSPSASPSTSPTQTTTSAPPATTSPSLPSLPSLPSPTPTPPPASSPSTAARPPTTQPPPSTIGQGGFVVDRIQPTEGYINQQTMVSIDGTFPSAVNVWFGDQPGDLVHQSDTWIIVVAPARSRRGPVDVTLRANSAGTVLVASNGFTYVDPIAGSVPPTTATTSPGPTTTVSTSPGPTTTAPSTSTSTGGGGADDEQTTTSAGSTTTDGGGATSTTTGSDSSTTVAASSTTTERPRLPRRARSAADADPIDLGGGLLGVSLPGITGLGDIAPCMSEPCRSRRI